jgi:anti-sigma B factor antagonist
MELQVKKESGGVALISIAGELDMSTSSKVRNALLQYFKRDTRGIVVDLSDVTYMDSSGIATMIEGLQWSTREGKRFVLAGIRDKVKDVFVLTNLHEVFEFKDNSENAFNDIAK